MGSSASEIKLPLTVRGEVRIALSVHVVPLAAAVKIFPDEIKTALSVVTDGLILISPPTTKINPKFAAPPGLASTLRFPSTNITLAVELVTGEEIVKSPPPEVSPGR